ncbi:biopolymer transporter ExbD [Solimonas sp. K1W22B-7]|uniref:ExbD/TolR family protein n=1 Tax=Solimonas sp. K1W22B-7 TaxID=2303331 RepID=UPI000E33709B|nr:biopolymer transporter ExbD [Solimonas sp. K1W22B-7]AXQ28492.1 biopolymer transporter ExbD [Solimonas sp. K1W22B-7]
MQARRHASDDGHHGIDLAPMLDFVLNLLIFFIIITSFVKQAGVKVDKEQAETAESRANGNILIAIKPNGEIWMDRKKVNLPEVRALVERMHAERPEDTVVILADKASESGVMAQVMDQVRGGGVQSVSVATRGQE